MSILEAKDLAQRYKQSYERDERLKERNEAREFIESRGGMDFSTGVGNLFKGYMFSDGPTVETRRSRGEVKQGLPPREFIKEGYQLPSALPDRPEDANLELGTMYFDINRGEFAYYTRSEPTRNRPQGTLKKNIVHTAKSLEQKQEISEMVAKGSSLDDIGKAIGVAEIAIAVPALVKGAVRFTPYAIRKAGDLISDIRYGDTSFSATRGVLPEPAAGVGANVVKKRTRAEINKQADAAREADAKGLLPGTPYERALAKSKSPWRK